MNVLEDDLPVYEPKNNKRKKKIIPDIDKDNEDINDSYFEQEKNHKSNNIKGNAGNKLNKKTRKEKIPKMKENKLAQFEDGRDENYENEFVLDNQDQLDDFEIEIREKGAGRRRKPEMLLEPENPLDSALDTVIDLNELNAKPKLTNSEMILAIIEICIHAMQYEIKYSNSTRLFWDEVYKKEKWTNIFTNFKAETIRKYWRTLRDVGDIKKVLETTQKYSASINAEEFK